MPDIPTRSTSALPARWACSSSHSNGSVARTELVHHYQKSPLQIMRPLYIDPRRPDLPVVYLMSTGGGIVQADRLRLDIDCGADAAVLVTTQAATKVHRMDTDYATQLVDIDVGAAGLVEYLPAPTIPYGGSRFHQRTVVTADPSATVLIADTVAAGRLAHGERHAYDVYASDFELRRPGGAAVAVDTVRLEPARAPVIGPGMWGGRSLMATLYAAGPGCAAAVLADELNAALDDPALLSGVSTLPGECGAWARVLGDHPPVVAAALRRAWDVTRRLLLGVPAPDLRRT